jgi:hypothetical protein
MIHSRYARALSVLAAVCCATGAAAAQQEITFAGVPWEVAADSFRARLDAAGMRHVRTMENGDLRFRTDDDVVVMAFVRQGKVVGVNTLVPAPGDSLVARLRVVVDSLRGVYGEPGFRDDTVAAWVAGGTRVMVGVKGASGPAPPHVSYFFAGPGYADEIASRWGVDAAFPALEPGWTLLFISPEERYAIDTVSVQRRGPGVYRARLRIDYAEPNPDPSGRHDTVIYAAEYDCSRRRMQLRSRTALLAGRRVREDAGATGWLPANAATPFGAQLDQVCRYAQQTPPAGGGS